MKTLLILVIIFPVVVMAAGEVTFLTPPRTKHEIVKKGAVRMYLPEKCRSNCLAEKVNCSGEGKLELSLKKIPTRARCTTQGGISQVVINSEGKKETVCLFKDDSFLFTWDCIL